jgi:LuxR family maltose regulon positive regulatory protein
LDDQRQWFRYHHLFKDLLRARLQHVKPLLGADLHKQAAAWFEENGLITEAIQHLLAAGETHRAADLIETYGPDFLANDDPSVLHLTDQLPIEIIYSHPRIGLHLAWLQIIQANTQKAIPLLYELSQHLGNQEPSIQNRWMQAVIDSALAFLFPRGSEQSSYPLPDYDQIDGIPSKEIFLRNAADFLYCMALARRGQMLQAVEIAARSVQREKNHHGSHSIPTLAPFLSRVYLILGRLHDAASLCNDYLNPANVKFIRFFYTAGSMKIDLGEVHLEWGFLDKAEDLIRDGLKDNEPWRDIMTHGIGFSTLARICIAKRDFSSAMQAAEILENRMRKYAKPQEFDEDFYTLKVRIMLASGDLAGTSTWADQVLNDPAEKENPGIYRYTLAQILLAQGRFSEVEKLLAGTTPPPSQHSQISKIIESKLLLAAAIAGQKRTNEAFELIESCIDIAEPESYIQIFHDLRDYVQELLSDYSKKEIFDDQPFIQKIMETLSTTKDDVKSPGTDQAVLIEALSEREVEVLQLIAEGKTNREIASQLIVAPGTVKAHTASIYRKLDAKNRTEAVAIARQMNILI